MASLVTCPCFAAKFWFDCCHAPVPFLPQGEHQGCQSSKGNGDAFEVFAISKRPIRFLKTLQVPKVNCPWSMSSSIIFLEIKILGICLFAAVIKYLSESGFTRIQ